MRLLRAFITYVPFRVARFVSRTSASPPPLPSRPRGYDALVRKCRKKKKDNRRHLRRVVYTEGVNTILCKRSRRSREPRVRETVFAP